MAAYKAHFPIRVLVQQNRSHVLRVLVDVTDIHIDLEVRGTKICESPRIRLRMIEYREKGHHLHPSPSRNEGHQVATRFC